MKKIGLSISNIIVIIILFLLCSCGAFSGIHDNSSFIYLSDKPINIFIDDTNNGLLVLKNIIFRITDLNITNNSPSLNDEDSSYEFGNASYFSDNKNNGLLIYSRYTKKNKKIADISTSGISGEPYYIAEQKNNIFSLVSKTYSFKDIDNANINIGLDNKNNYFFYYETRYENSNSQSDGFILKTLKNNIVSTYNIDKYDDISLNKLLNRTFLNVNIDNNGDGLYSYIYYYDKELIHKKISNYSSDKNNEIKTQQELSNSEGTIDYSQYIDEKIDSVGNGFWIIYNSNNPNLSIEKISDFKGIINKEVIYKDSISGLAINNNGKYGINLDINGNGIILIQKDERNSSNKIQNKYISLKKVSNFKLDDKEYKIIDQNVDSAGSNKNAFYYYKSAINSKGNGFVILKKDDSETYIAKKIINYEPEK